MSTVLHWATLIAYVAGGLVSIAYLGKQRAGLYRMGLAVLWVGFGLHSAALAAAWAQDGMLPAANLRQSLDLFSWAIMGAALVVNLRLDLKIMGAVAGPLCALMLLAASVLPKVQGVTSPAFKSLWIVAHVLAIMAGYGLLALTFLGGVLYLLQDHALRAKKLGPVFQRLPSLGRLDSLSHTSLVAGFLLMTIGLITGAVYAQMTLGSYWRWDPKEVWALITWLLYAALLHTRLVQGWRGRRGAWLALAAFAVLVFTFLGAGLLFPGYHSFASLAGFGGATP
ncbi:MAG: c-type cytochrome biogenesis protein CcsB [Desulfarculaceae bacterium]|nr:c-type cytochrome biogenesis protein CcsB [Desulfarculaceae bacterium]MCF8073710.1 c-type cytochrome biogenesis protein CcsB [Desulfarculaceae bacterium]MCF8101951.1 c-type cytochrome biogenesis protein CcsB [Desulfarculaceae bacterium]MCF8115921.1 c-type cytochrome biogenesis protein CcsB [Desulfarculaceae bacterium]